MINTLIVDAESSSVQTLTKHLHAYCPKVKIGGIAQTRQEACRLFQELRPELVFIEMEMVSYKMETIFQQTSIEFETIILHPDYDYSNGIKYLKAQGAGHLIKPVTVKDLVIAVFQAQRWLRWKKKWEECHQLLAFLHSQSPPNDRIGIPTLEGMEFLKIVDILRCEGLQRLTRVITIKNDSIISSYNIGAFCKLLCNYGFFSPHKSHLINLQHVQKYHAEGTIILTDGSSVPVSRRRKSLFLQQMQHL